MPEPGENLIRFTLSSVTDIFQQRGNRIWIVIILGEICLGLAQVFAPLYTLPILFTSILFLFMLINIEVPYYVLLVSSVLVAPFVINITYSEQLVESLFLTNLIVFPVLIFWMLSISTKAEPIYHSTPLDVPIIFLLLWGLVSLLWTHNPIHGLYQWGRLVNFYLLFFLSVAIIQSREVLHRTLWAWIWTGVIFSGGTILGRFLPKEADIFWITPYLNVVLGFGGSETLRTSSMASTAVTAAGLNLCIFITVGMYFITEKQSTKRLLIFLALFMMAGMMLPRSRAGVGGLFVGLIFFYSRFPQFRKILLRVSLAILLVIFLIYFATAVTRLEMALQRWLNLVVSHPRLEATALNRIGIWATGFSKLIESYGFGTGIGGLKGYLTVPHAHSIYFSVLFDLGFIGFWILVWIIATIVNTILNGIRSGSESFSKTLLWAYGGGLIAFGIHGITDFEYPFSGFFEVPLFIGLIMATVRLALKERVSGESKSEALS